MIRSAKETLRRKLQGRKRRRKLRREKLFEGNNHGKETPEGYIRPVSVQAFCLLKSQATNVLFPIERSVIITDELWLAEEVWPTELLRQWLNEQHIRGIWVKFVRQSVLEQEPDLIADIGIYGSRALGVQELDERCAATI